MCPRALQMGSEFASSPGQSSHILAGHTGPINSIDLSADGRMAVTGSDDATVRLWNITSGVRIPRAWLWEWAACHSKSFQVSIYLHLIHAYEERCLSFFCVARTCIPPSPTNSLSCYHLTLSQRHTRAHRFLPPSTPCPSLV